MFGKKQYGDFRHPDFLKASDDRLVDLNPSELNPDQAADPTFGAEEHFLKVSLAGLLELKQYHCPEDLLGSVIGYFNWVNSFPLSEQKASAYQGIVEFYNLPRKRCPTRGGLCLFIGVEVEEWKSLRDGDRGDEVTTPQFRRICAWAEEEIIRQKFENAAAGLLNPMIIARDLGLSEKSEITGKDGEPLQPLTLDPSKLSQDVMEAILSAQNKD